MEAWKIAFIFALAMGLIIGIFVGGYVFRQTEVRTVMDKKAALLSYVEILTMNNITASYRVNPISFIWHPEQTVPILTFANWLEFLKANNIKSCYWTLTGFERTKNSDAGFWFVDESRTFYYWRLDA